MYRNPLPSALPPQHNLQLITVSLLSKAASTPIIILQQFPFSQHPISHFSAFFWIAVTQSNNNPACTATRLNNFQYIKRQHFRR